MEVLIISNINDQKGLYRDATLLAELLDSLGHTAMIIDFRDRLVIPCDLALHLEVVVPELFSVAKQSWWVPNPEWANEEYLKYLDQFDKVLYKTRDAERLIPTLCGVYTGFMSENHYDPTVKRERVFFHSCRGTIAKGTSAIKELWTRDFPYPIVIADGLSDEDFRHEQNRCLFHLYPSQYEGWGQSLWESLSVGALLLTTNIPPMSEMQGVSQLIPITTVGKQNLATTGFVSPMGIKKAVEWCWSLKPREIELKSQIARSAWECSTRDFKERFASLLGD